MEHVLDIKALRKKHGMTQADLAEAAGVNTATVWRWEKNGVPARGPARAFLERLAADAHPPEAMAS